MKIYVCIISLLLLGCSASDVFYGKQDKNWTESAPKPQSKLEYSLYLIGDAGADTSLSRPVLSNLAKHLKVADSNKSGVVFLGDNVYPLGLRKKNSKYRKEDETRLDAQLNTVKNFGGNVVFLAGNHDWKQGKPNGINAVKRQEKYIVKHSDNKSLFLPGNGCPGPTEIQLAPGLLLISIDTQWWLQQFEKSSGEKDGCDVRSTEELKKAFKDMLKKYRNQNIIVAAHHPLVSNGPHGGNFQFKDHLFPLTAKYKNAYVPIPILGSIYPFYRKFIGLRQDIVNPIYTDMKNQLEEVINGFDNVVYVAGHEHNLQYVHEDSYHHIVSGSGSKVTKLRLNNTIDFGGEGKGFSKISYYENGEMWLEHYMVNVETRKEKVVFRKLLYTKKPVLNTTPKVYTKKSYKDMFVTVYPDSLKGTNKKGKKLLLGELNRDLWTAPVKVPYLDIHFEKGGLTPIKKGGGMQTLSLRMLGGDGKQYTLRGIKKSPEFIITKKLRGTLAQDVVYDGFAGSHPYAAVVIPYLSEEAEIYYSDAKLVYVPKDSVLGDYLDEFGGMFCLLEQRPNKDVSDQDNFGNSKDVMNFHKMLEKVHSKYNHKVDKDFTVRTRVFDMLIGDFDRHDDQWRWAKIKKDKFNYYRPIPRDRDQAFFKADGIAMKITKWPWLLWYTQDFYGGADDVLGLNSQARHFDRSFLAEATREDWIAQAKFIQQNLSDQEIEDAVHHFPKEVFDIRGEEIIESLKIRRDELDKYVEEYYSVLAKEVDLVGTYLDDFVDIERKDNGDVEVKAYPRKKGKRVKRELYYHRIFKFGETKEIRIYGLDGNDEYHITGKSKKSILIRIVAGEGKDKIIDKSKVRGLRNYTQIYDLKGKSKIEEGKDTKVSIMTAEEMYDYNRLAFKYNKIKPALSVGYNPNDGFFIGPGFNQTIHGFKKAPYKFNHRLVVNYMFGAEGYNVYYRFNFVDAIGKGDFGGNLTINNPLVYDYYGDERDTNTNDNTAFSVSMNNYKFEPKLTFSSSNHANRLIVGIQYNYVNFENQLIPNVEKWEVETQNFVGLKLEYQFLNKDDKLNPHSGMAFKLGGEYINSVDNGSVNFLNLKSSLSLFIPIHFIRKQTTLALRFGIATNIGDYAFFQSNFLSGYENFRGVRRNRYAGRTSSFNNVEWRMNLFKVPNYLIPFEVGVLAHYDFARIWNLELRDWHTSFGGGTYITALESFMLFGTYSVSNNASLFVVGGKFLF